MLDELRVENLLLIERAELRLGPGPERADGRDRGRQDGARPRAGPAAGRQAAAGIVRPGRGRGVRRGRLRAARGAAGGAGGPSGRTRRRSCSPVACAPRAHARLPGRPQRRRPPTCATSAARCSSFYGQHEHRRLTLASAQLEILDGFCGAEQARAAGVHRRIRAGARRCEAALEELRERAGARERELDLLEWELEEIERPPERGGGGAGCRARAAAPRRGAARRRPGGAGGARAAEGAARRGRRRWPARGARRWRRCAGSTRRSTRWPSARALAVEADDLAGELRRYAESVEADAGPPGGGRGAARAARPPEAQARRHDRGGARARRACRARRDELAGAEEALEDGDARLDAARASWPSARPSCATRAGGRGPRLADAVVERLADLAMEGATFEVALSRARRLPARRGGDEVEFLIAPNPGVPAGPLREIASGGELCRVMLALMSVAAEAGPATLVFDEIDAGIGGQTARAVGEQLRDLAEGRQVICITHLPQIASLAERHFRSPRTRPASRRGRRSRRSTGRVVGELVRMLGAERRPTSRRAATPRSCSRAAQDASIAPAIRVRRRLQWTYPEGR